jgi:hypothetical protein
LDLFYADPRSPDGKHPRCRACAAKAKADWKKANPERAKTHQQRYVGRNPEAVRASKLAYFEANKEKATAATRKWQAENPHKRNAITARRYADKTRATPAWANLRVIEMFYLHARHLSETTGEPHHVDHIIPLRNKWVCGLHVEHNLQVLTGAENVKKLNRFKPDWD